MRWGHNTPLESELKRKVLKKAGINTKGLISNKRKYGTSPLVFSYDTDSVWYLEYHWRSGHIQINTKYFEITESVRKYNKTLGKYIPNTLSETLEYPYGK